MKKKKLMILAICVVLVIATGWVASRLAPVTVYCVESIKSVKGNGYEVICQYDESGNLLRLKRTETKRTPADLVMTYDENGNLLTYSDDTGAEMTCVYDPILKRMTVKEEVGENTVRTSVYDKNGNLLSYVSDYGESSDLPTHRSCWTYDWRGNLLSVLRLDGERYRYGAYLYDWRGNLLASVSLRDGALYHSTWRTYDLFGKIVREEEMTSEGYASLDGTPIEPRPVEHEFYYDDAGRLIADAWSDGDGYERSYTWEYDEAGRLCGFNEGYLHHKWTYDADGNVATYQWLYGSVMESNVQYSYVCFEVPRWRAEKIQRMQKAIFQTPEDWLWPTVDDEWKNLFDKF